MTQHIREPKGNNSKDCMVNIMRGAQGSKAWAGTVLTPRLYISEVKG